MHKHIPAIPAELSLGGVVKTATLRQHGYTQQEIRKAVDSNTLIRVREGWYAAQGADQRVVQAVSRGGILGCASAIAFHGGWALKDGKTHTYCAQRGRQKTSPKKTSPVGKANSRAKCCPSPKYRRAYQTGVLPLADALVQSAFCLHPYDFLVVAESLIYRELMTREEVKATMAGINHRITSMMAKMDVSESGTETLVRLRLRRHGVTLIPQVTIPDVGRVDFLVGKRLIIEVDGVDHHGSGEAFERDRARDQDLIGLGYIVIRISYRQVMYGWDRVEARILRVLRLGLHQRALPEGTPLPIVTPDQDHQDYSDDLDRE